MAHKADHRRCAEAVWQRGEKPARSGSNELVQLIIREVSVKHFDPETDPPTKEKGVFKTKIRTKWYLVNISLFASDLFPAGLQTGETSSDLKRIGSAGNGTNRTDWSLAIRIAIPFSKWGAEPFVASPSLFPADAQLKAQSSAPPKKKIPPTHPFQLALLWQQQIASDSTLNKARIAAREGLSRARVTHVTQVMNLLRLPKQVRSQLQNLPPPLQIHSFTERHLRRLLSIKGDEAQVRDWLELLQKFKNADGE